MPALTNIFQTKKHTCMYLELAFLLAVIGTFLAVTRFTGASEHSVLIFTDLSWLIVSFITGIRCWLAGNHYSNKIKSGWRYFAIGCFVWSLGLAYWAYKELIEKNLTPFPAFSDAGFMLMAPFFLLGFYHFKSDIRQIKFKLLDLSQLGIIISAVLLIHLIVFIEPIITSKESLFYITVAVSYPVLYMSILIYVLIHSGSRSRTISTLTYNLLLLGFLIQAITDSAYAYSLLGKNYAVGNFIDVLWIVAFCVTYAGAVVTRYAVAAVNSEAPSKNIFGFDYTISSVILFTLAIITWLYIGDFELRYIKYMLPAFSVLLFFIALYQLLNFYEEQALYQRIIETEKLFSSNLEKEVLVRTRQLEEEISLHKMTLQQLSEAQRIGKMGHWRWDLCNDEIVWSDEIYNIFGLKKDDSNKKFTFEEFNAFVSPEDREPLQNIIETSLSSGLKYNNTDHRIITPSGIEKWVHEEAHFNYKEDDNKIPDFIIGTVQDVTEQKYYERKLVEAMENAEIANSAKSEFLSRMSHELRTPLNAIVGFSQLLSMDENLTKDQVENINDILQGGEILLNLINELLDIAKIEAGTLDLKLVNISLTENINRALSLTQAMAIKNGISIHYDGVHCDCVINVDELKFKQIMINLITNAIKYNKPNGEIFITCKHVIDSCEISVRDTGLGIPENMIDDVFVEFSRVASDTQGIDGVGIGLYVTKHFTERMGGNIKVRSTYGEETIFTISFPCCEIKHS